MPAGGKYLLMKDNNAFLHCMDVENRDCGDMKAKDILKNVFFVRRERNSEMIGLASEGKKPLRLREGQLTRSSGHVCFGSASRVSFSHSTRLHSHDFTNAPDLSLVKKLGLIKSSAH